MRHWHRRAPLAFVVVALWAVVTDAQAAGRRTAAPPDREVWITIDSRELDALREDIRAVAGDRPPLPLEQQDGVTLAVTRESLLEDLAVAMHARYHRCGGFITHETRAEALETLYAPAPSTSPSTNYTIDNAAVVNALMGQVQPANIASTITTLSSYWTRFYTTQTGYDAAVWLGSRWEQITAGRSDITVSFFDHPSWLQHSVIAKIEGTDFPKEVVVLGGHVDSINTSDQEAGRAPGADDDASGIASLTETLRALVATGYRPARTVMFIAYAGEEAGLRGSRDIAGSFALNAHGRPKYTTIGALQLDMTDYKNPAGNAVDIGILADANYTNAAQNLFVKQLRDAYLPFLTVNTTSVCGYGCPDPHPWTAAGVPASLPFEGRFGQHNMNLHTPNDTLANSDPTCVHAAKFSKLAAAYMAELAKGVLQP